VCNVFGELRESAKGRWTHAMMQDKGKTKAQLINELAELRQRLAESEAAGSARNLEHTQVEQDLQESEQQLRMLADHWQAACEGERKDMAQRIHDDVGHALSLIKMNAAWLARRLKPPPQTARELTNMRTRLALMSHNVDECISTVRSIAAELRPALLNDVGLIAALEWESAKFQERTEISCNFEVLAEDVILTRGQTTALFRVYQELLRNVFAHARATVVNVTLGKAASHVFLKVSDNGIGITEEQMNSPESLGLQGVRERLIILNGEIDIEGLAGKGTTITVRIPTGEQHGEQHG